MYIRSSGLVRKQVKAFVDVLCWLSNGTPLGVSPFEKGLKRELGECFYTHWSLPVITGEVAQEL